MTENFCVLACDAARRCAARLRRAAPTKASSARLEPEAARSRCKSPGRCSATTRSPELTARRVHRRRLPAHRRQGRARRGGQPEDHRPREGAVQDQQGQVRRAGADREPAGDARRRRGLRASPAPTSASRSASSCSTPRRRCARPSRRSGPRSKPRSARISSRSTPARSARAARLHRGRDDAVVGRERLHHADLQGQAESGRGDLRPDVRGLGRGQAAGGLGLKRGGGAA